MPLMPPMPRHAPLLYAARLPLFSEMLICR